MSETFVVPVGTPGSTENNLNSIPLPVFKPLFISNAGTVSAFFSYTEVLPAPFRGHELKPGQTLYFPGVGQLFVNADCEVPLIISTL